MAKKERYEVVVEITCQTDFDGEYTLAVVDSVDTAKDTAGRLATFFIQTFLQMEMGCDEDNGIIEVYVRRQSDNSIIHREAL